MYTNIYIYIYIYRYISKSLCVLNYKLPSIFNIHVMHIITKVIMTFYYSRLNMFPLVY